MVLTILHSSSIGLILKLLSYLQRFSYFRSSFIFSYICDVDYTRQFLAYIYIYIYIYIYVLNIVYWHQFISSRLRTLRHN